MQPPPRKGNYAKFLKNLHSEQVAKLQLKNQHESDLLEDIRNFTIKKSAVEKSYSEALLKISSAYLNKKMPNIPDIKLDGGEEKWNMWNVWRTVLEENEKLARARLAAIEVFQQQIADEAKVLRAHKISATKKAIDQVIIVQKELQACVQDVDKTKKLYFDEEHSAHDVRDKAKDIEEKLKKKKGSFFQSITSLQKNSAKFSSKREQLEEKSSGARNDYLLSLAAANAHQNRYFAVDLQMAIQIMESGVYDKVAEYLMLMGRTELLTCSAMQNSFGKIRDQAQQLTREYNLKCCYLFYPVLKQHIQYEFDPCDNDPVDHITADHESAAATLSKEARRWASRIARENNNIRESVRKLQIYSALRDSGQKVDPNDQNGPDLETKIDEMKQCIRRAETAKMKAEARIECLRAGGVNVDEWMQEAETLSVQDIPRSASSLSMRTDASGTAEQPSSDSFYDSEGEVPVLSGGPNASEKMESIDVEETQDTDYDTAEVDAMLEQERQRIEQLTAGWDDPTKVDWGVEDDQIDEQRAEAVKSVAGLKCTALYSYTAQNPDELSIVENEQLEVVGEGDGDGWLRARNYRGEEGFVPHNYLDVDREIANQTAGLQTQISFSSVDYTVDEQDEEAFVNEQTDQTQSPEQISVISVPIHSKTDDEDVQENDEDAIYCCAVYDYEANGPDELTFEECDVIKVLNKCAHGVDDGWWEGEIDGRRGFFPSLVVEECDINGEPLTNQWEETPPCSAPPVFTPPDVPNFLLQPAEVIITQATPIGELPQTEINDKKEDDKANAQETTTTISDKSQGFQMELTRNQQQQYTTQFDGERETVSEHKKPFGIPCVTIEGEDNQKVGGENNKSQNDQDFGLGVAQIVITAATPMHEEPEQPFPPPDDKPLTNGDETGDGEETGSVEHVNEIIEEEMNVQDDSKNKDDVDEEKSIVDDQPTDSAPFPTSSSTGSDVDSTGPSTAENSQSLPPSSTGSVIKKSPPKSSGGDTSSADVVMDTSEIIPDDEIPKQVVGGRASIPDELEPHQLAQLQDLKESNA